MVKRCCSLSDPQGPLVTVIIPSFNSMTGTKNIEQTIDSIQNQSYKNIEILVIDNFSTDSTRQVCERKNVRFLTIHAGRAQARNEGIKKMNGQYAFFCDSDFVLSPSLVEDCVIKSIQFGADCISVKVCFVGVKKRYINCSEMRNIEIKSGLGAQSLILFFDRNLIPFTNECHLLSISCRRWFGQKPYFEKLELWQKVSVDPERNRIRRFHKFSSQSFRVQFCKT